MATHIHPTSPPTVAMSEPRPHRHWSPLHWGVTCVLGVALTALVIVWSSVVPSLLGGWSALTPFETPIAVLAVAVLSALTLAVGCLTAASVVWR